MASRVGPAIFCTGMGATIGAIAMDSFKNTERSVVIHKPQALTQKQLERDTYVSGGKFLNSSEANTGFYSYKQKNEQLDKFLQSEPNFYPVDTLFNGKVDKTKISQNKDVVKLIIDKDSAVFVEASGALSGCKGCKGTIIDPLKEFKFDN